MMPLWRHNQKGALFTCLDYSCPAVYCSLHIPEEYAVFWRSWWHCDLNIDSLAHASVAAACFTDSSSSLYAERRQTMLFSATQTRRVEDLARISLKKEPLYVGVDDDKEKATVDGLEQVIC